MKFLSKLLGRKIDGATILIELLDRARSLKTDLEAAPDFLQFLGDKGQALTEDGEIGFIAGVFIEFGKDATAGASLARRLFDGLNSNQIDCGTLHEVEFYVMLMAANAALLAESLALAIDKAPDPIGAIHSMYSDDADERVHQLAHILEVGELAGSVSLHRSLNSPDYVSDFLELRIRPTIPEEIAENARPAWERCQRS